MMLDWLYAIKYQKQIGQVTVMDVTLKPADIPDGLLLKVTIAPLSEEEKAFKRAALKEDVEMGAATIEDYIRELRPLENPEEIQKKIRVQRIVDSVLGSEQFLGGILQQVTGQTAEPVMPAPQGTVPAEVPVPEPTNGSSQQAADYASSVINAPALPGGPTP